MQPRALAMGRSGKEASPVGTKEVAHNEHTRMSIAEKFVSMEYGPAPEDPKEALTWLDQHGRRFGHFINGKWRDPQDGVFFDTTDPATGEKIASVSQGSSADVDAAVKAARKAFPEWQALSGHKRA